MFHQFFSRRMSQLAPPLRWVVAVVLVGLALVLTWWIPPLHRTPFPLYFAAVTLLATWWGRALGYFATFLSSLTLIYFFLVPGDSVWLDSSGAVQFGMFLLVALWINSICSGRKAAEEELRQQAVKLRRSEEEFRDFFDNAVVGLHCIGPDGTIIRANQAELDLLGYSREEYVGRDIADFHADADVISDILRHLQAGEVIRDYETCLRRKDGSIKPVLIDANVCWEEGRFVHTRCFTRDLSDRKRLEEQVRRAHEELEQRVLERTAELSRANDELRREIVVRQQAEAAHRQLAAIVESSTDAIYGKTLEGVVTSWNAAAERLFGYSAQESVGHMIASLIPPERWDEHEQIMQRIIQDEAVPSFDTVRERKDGQRVDVSVATSPIKNVEGQIIGASVITRDISQHVRSERRRSARLAVTEVLAQASTMGEAIPQILRAICQSLDCDLGALWTIDGEAQVLRCFDLWQEPSSRPSRFETASRQTAFSPGVGLPGRVWLSGQPTWIADVAKDDNFPRARVAAAEGLHAAFAFPVTMGGNLHGVIEFFSRQVLAPDPDLLEMMATVGSQIGQFAQRKQSESAMRESEERLRSVTQAAVDAIISADSRGCITSWNQGAHNIFGFTEEEVLGQPLTVIIPERYRQAYQRGLDRLQRTGSSRVLGKLIELHGRRKDASEFPLELSLAEWKVGDRQFFSGVLRDITERRRLEHQFQQSQKMEAIGCLAGGVAHDFNNVLTIIAGYGEIALSIVKGNDELREYIEQMIRAGERASALTRQLLAFSRKQILQPKVLDLNALILDLQKMLHRVIGEDIELRTSLSPALDLIRADPGQMEQVIMNLAINARDAMPHGGDLVIETDNVTLDADLAASLGDAYPGQYVLLTVSDTGCGMDAQTQVQAFEPFFTTKGPGKGTGLGLATVHGIVEQSGGRIRIDSQLGRGTRFLIYLPVIDELADDGKALLPEDSIPKGTETVLLVEDERDVLTLTSSLLRKIGYQVLEAGCSADALQISASHPGSIDLLVTDVVMPGQNGRSLADQLATARPQTKVLFVSGHTDDAVLRHGILKAETNFLQKPFSRAALGNKVREALDA